MMLDTIGRMISVFSCIAGHVPSTTPVCTGNIYPESSGTVLREVSLKRLARRDAIVIRMACMVLPAPRRGSTATDTA